MLGVELNTSDMFSSFTLLSLEGTFCSLLQNRETEAQRARGSENITVRKADSGLLECQGMFGSRPLGACAKRRVGEGKMNQRESRGPP